MSNYRNPLVDAVAALLGRRPEELDPAVLDLTVLDVTTTERELTPTLTGANR